MNLTPEERQRIYEEEKARLEAQERLRSESRAREALSIPESQRAQSRRAGIAWLSAIGAVLGLLVLLAVFSSLASKRPSTASGTDAVKDTGALSATPQSSQAGKEELLKSIGMVTTGLQDMKTDIAGETMDHIKFSLEVFNAAAVLIQRANGEQLTEEERAKVAELRRNLVLRQRQAFPVIRDKAGPIFSKELWMSDGEARTFGERFTTILFVHGSLAANANIAQAHLAIRASLIKMRFKQAQYKWYERQGEYNYYVIESPKDGEIAIVDSEGTVTPVPE